MIRAKKMSTDLRRIQDTYGLRTITIVYKDLVSFLIEKDMIDEFKAWKKRRRRAMASERMLRFEANSDEETDSVSTSSSEDESLSV